MLVSVLDYREITGDTATASGEVERVLVEAQGLLEDELERPLEQDTFTERLPIVPDPVNQVAQVFPRVTPIISVDGGLTHEQGVIYGASPTSVPGFGSWGSPPMMAEVTYTAGFDPDETDPNEVDYLPRYIQRDIAWAAKALLEPTPELSGVPAGATSVRSGDQAVTFDKGYRPGQTAVVWSTQTLRWKRRHP